MRIHSVASLHLIFITLQVVLSLPEQLHQQWTTCQSEHATHPSRTINAPTERSAIQERDDLVSPPPLSYGTVRPFCSIFRQRKTALPSSSMRGKVHFANSVSTCSGRALGKNNAGGSTESVPISRKRKTYIGIALLSFPTVSLIAKLGLLQGPIGSNDGKLLPYSDGLIARDLISSIFCTALAWVLTKTFTVAAKKGVLSSQDSRKCIHTFAAPLFMLFWPIFSSAAGARFFAAIPLLLNALRLLIAGSSSGSDEGELANAISRSGDAKEALGGPLIYALVTLAAILAFWRDSLIGIVAISTLAAGDGMADLIGRRYGKSNKWFFSSNKSVVGSLAFFGASTICSIGISFWLSYTGTLVLPLEQSSLVIRIAIISAICTAIELIPIGDDNLTVPGCAAILSSLLLV